MSIAWEGKRTDVHGSGDITERDSIVGRHPMVAHVLTGGVVVGWFWIMLQVWKAVLR